MRYAVVVFIVVPKNKNLRAYSEKALALLEAKDTRLIEARGEDVPSFVEEYGKLGRPAIGFTGEDLFREYMFRNYRSGLRVLRTIPWYEPDAMFGKPALCLIGPGGCTLDTLPRQQRVAIAGKYRLIAKRYLNLLEESRGFSFAKLYLNGSVETSCSEGISDLVIDIVYSGATIRRLGLEVIDKVFESNFVIIGGKNDTDNEV